MSADDGGTFAPVVYALNKVRTHHLWEDIMDLSWHQKDLLKMNTHLLR